MKVQLNIYLDQEIADFLRREAVKRRISLSALIAEQLTSMPDRMMEIQRQIADCFDRQIAAINAVLDTTAQALAANSGDGLLARARVKNRDVELMIGALNQFDGQLDRATSQQLEQLRAKGKELLAQRNGASH